MACRTRHLEPNDIAVGIDLAGEKHVAVLLSAQGERLTRFSIPHSRQGMKELIRRCALPRGGPARVAWTLALAAGQLPLYLDGGVR